MPSLPTKVLTPSEVVKGIKGFRNFGAGLFSLRSSSIQIDSILFRLHSLITVYILLVGTMFLTMRQYFGEPIECFKEIGKAADKLLQHYCWMEGAFSILPKPSTTQTHLPQQNHFFQAYAGVTHQSPNDKIVYHKYYQWGYWVLIVQSFLFYLPRYIWKLRENERLKDVISDLRNGHIASFKEGEKVRVIQDLADAMYVGGGYFWWFTAIEVACLLHLFTEIYFTDLFLGGGFLKLGFEWFYYAHTNPQYYHDPLITMFPRITKCCFHTFGVSGTIQTQDMMCYMPMNIVFEKLYVIVWCWFLFLLLFTSSLLCYRALLCFPWFRYFKLSLIAPSADRHALRKLCKDVGHYFILEMIAVNLKTAHFVDVLEELMDLHFDKKGRPTYKSTLRESIAKGNYVAPPKHRSDKKKSKSKHKTDDTGAENVWLNPETTNTWNEEPQDNGWANNDTQNEPWDATATAPADDDWNGGGDGGGEVDWPEA